jgi:hypothetical protein
MPNIPDPIITPAILPTDFEKEDVPAETDDLKLGERGLGGQPVDDADLVPDFHQPGVK